MPLPPPPPYPHWMHRSLLEPALDMTVVSVTLRVPRGPLLRTGLQAQKCTSPGGQALSALTCDGASPRHRTCPAHFVHVGPHRTCSEPPGPALPPGEAAWTRLSLKRTSLRESGLFFPALHFGAGMTRRAQGSPRRERQCGRPRQLRWEQQHQQRPRCGRAGAGGRGRPPRPEKSVKARCGILVSDTRAGRQCRLAVRATAGGVPGCPFGTSAVTRPPWRGPYPWFFALPLTPCYLRGPRAALAGQLHGL